jgi:hypothetical protein
MEAVFSRLVKCCGAKKVRVRSLAPEVTLHGGAMRNPSFVNGITEGRIPLYAAR